MAKQPSSFSAVFTQAPAATPIHARPATRVLVEGPLLELSPLGRLVVPLAVFVVAALTIELSHGSNVATIWPANAVMLTALLRCVRSIANTVAIVLGGALASAFAGIWLSKGFLFCFVIGAANASEALVAFGLLAVFHVGPSTLTTFRGVMKLILLAGVAAPVAGTLISAMAYSSEHGLEWFTLWRNWYAGHALGMIIVAPFLICVTSSEWRTQRMSERVPEAVVMFVSFATIGACTVYFRPAIFMVAPAILFATVRFGLIGATASTFMIAMIATTIVVLGVGQPLVPSFDLSQRIFTLQMFLAITAFWSLPTASLLTERDRLLGDLSDANAQLAADSERQSNLVTGLRRHLALAEEKERLRLSYELHDQAGQSLIAAILELNEIDALTSGPAHERLHLLRKKMEEMGKTLHRIAWELRPPSIDEVGLCRALESYVVQWGEQCGTDVDFHCDDPTIQEVPAEIGTAVYRIVQEGLTNIVKHAQRPTSVSVIVRRLDRTLQVIVEDNGCGFDVAALGDRSATHRGLGLDGMRERLSLVGGSLEVESAPGAGTTIFARIAIEEQRSAA